MLDFDLRHILAALGPLVRGYSRTVSGVAAYDEALDATGEQAGQLEKLVVSGKRIHGGELRDLADGVQQVIWGEFHAYEDPSADTPAISVRAIDSSFYKVATNDPRVLESLRAAFR